ncbi:glycosyltransferase [Formosa sp. 4Alg 33]|uniref:glycosyltransferase n=1 Tax=Formosa sp. 4Alg 33 TaxID=3382189 RepID=UPI003D9C0020
MISIIIPSRSSVALEAITNNISATIGVPFEIIDYDNSKDGYGICKIYNLCAVKAKYDYLVFCHDDIVFHTQDWGQLFVNHLKQEFVGLVGITGATFKSKYPAPWVSIPKNYYRSNLYSSKENIRVKKESNSDEVAVVDGCFLGMRKGVWEQFNFNEDTLKGFHIYDIDISIRILRKYKVIVLNDILIEHKSDGVFNYNWYEESEKYHKHNQNLLPAQVESVKNVETLNGFALKSLVMRSKGLKLSFQKKANLLFLLLTNHPKMFTPKMLRIFFN